MLGKLPTLNFDILNTSEKFSYEHCRTRTNDCGVFYFKFQYNKAFLRQGPPQNDIKNKVPDTKS